MLVCRFDHNGRVKPVFHLYLDMVVPDFHKPEYEDGRRLKTGYTGTSGSAEFLCSCINGFDAFEQINAA